MSKRVRESELVKPALQAAATKPSGVISTSELIDFLENTVQPTGKDAQIARNRNDSYFSQKVRNLICHRSGPTSIFSRGLAIYTGFGIQITDRGRKMLASGT